MHTDITNGKPDFTNLDEVVAEIDAQYHRFLELIGKKPDYFEGHAVGKRSYISIINMAKQKSILRGRKILGKGLQSSIIPWHDIQPVTTQSKERLLINKAIASETWNIG